MTFEAIKLIDTALEILYKDPFFLTLAEFHQNVKHDENFKVFYLGNYGYSFDSGQRA